MDCGWFESSAARNPIVPMSRPSWIPLFLSLLFAGPLPAAERNIVFFITDDMGQDTGAYGNRSVRTPHLDALAADGVLFPNAYATTASCSASRSVVMSGLHNHANGQYGHVHNWHKFESWHHLAPLTLPRVLTAAGYRTAQIGKFHVAPEEVYQFETYIPGPDRNPVAMAEASREFILAQDDRPFLLYFATSDPHRGGGVDETHPERPDLFGNKPDRGAWPGVDEVFYDPEDVDVPPFLPDTPATRAELAQYHQSCSRIDQGLGRLVAILKEAGVYDRTLIVFTSDHGVAFPGAKTTVYDPGLRVPFIVRNPYAANRGLVNQAMISHVDITPSLLDFAGALDPEKQAPRKPAPSLPLPPRRPGVPHDNPGSPETLKHYHGRSWVGILEEPEPAGWDLIFASHTFHEIQMYYPMRVIQDRQYKLIWNIAHQLPYPFASDLWDSATWQAQWRLGPEAPFGQRTVDGYVNRPRFEFYDLRDDPHESRNLALDPRFAETLRVYQEKLHDFQVRHKDPWILKWRYE